MKFKKIIQIFVLIIVFGSLYNIKAMDSRPSKRLKETSNINIEMLPSEMIGEILEKMGDPRAIDQISQADINQVKTIALLRKDDKKVSWQKKVDKSLEALKNSTYEYLNQFLNNPTKLINKASGLNTEFSRLYVKNLINPDSEKYNAEIAEKINEIYKNEVLKAINQDQFEQIKFLINVGVNPNIGERTFEITALIAAVNKGNEEMVRFLLKNGKTDPNIKGPIVGTPLIKAAVNGNKEIVKLLLKDTRTNPNIPDRFGE